MKACKTQSDLRSTPLTSEGKPPRLVRRAARAALPLGLALFSLVACASQDEHQVIPPIVLGMNDQVAPSYEDNDVSMFTVTTPVELPVRMPTDAERARLAEPVAPYPSTPFLLATDIRVEIRFTISNLDDRERAVELLIDPWNEFVRYVPGISTAGEEAMPNFSGFDKFFVVPPKGRVVGTLTHDDTRELMIDLATAQNILANAPAGEDEEMGPAALVNRAFNIQNRSNNGDPVLTPWIPKVIAGLTGFDLGLRTFSPANVAVEILIDVTDTNGDRVIPAGKSGARIGVPPAELSPAGE